MTSSDETSKKYTRDEILSVMESFQAKTEDYLIKTIFKILSITEGEFYSKHERRLSNIIFNNADVVIQTLTCSVFFEKTVEIVKRDLESRRYISCIYPNLEYKEPVPVLVQYFDKQSGVRQRLLGFRDDETSVISILSFYGIVERIVGYCGDYCYKDPGMPSAMSNELSNLIVISQNSVKNLPCYREYFVKRLFDLLADYLPANVVRALESLGETLLSIGDRTHFANELLYKYKVWSSQNEHIVGSDFAEFVCKNFTAVGAYFEPYHHLPFSVSSLLSSVQQRFLLFFLKETYNMICKIELTDDNAVVYYFYLLKIRDLFKMWEANHVIPSKAFNFLNAQVKYLVENRELTLEEDEVLIKNLFIKVTKDVDETHARAVKFIEPLLQYLEYFEDCSWFLLKESINEDLLHRSFHRFFDVTCENCNVLLKEVKIVNNVLTQIPILDILSVEKKWLEVFKLCRVPKVSQLVEYLFALPVSCQFQDIENVHPYGFAKSMVKSNLKKDLLEAIKLDTVKDFFSTQLEQAREIITRNKVPLLLD